MCQEEINLIGHALIIGDKKGVLKDVQEILKPFVINEESVDLYTICRLENLLDTKFINIGDVSIKDQRRKKLDQLKIATGEITPKKIFLKFDLKTGIIELEYDNSDTNKM